MKKTLFLLASLIVISVLVLPEIVDAKAIEDRGPLTKRVFIHYRNPKGKSDNKGKNPKAPASEGSYTYIANGMKWKTTENYILNSYGAPEGTLAAIAAGMNTWDIEVPDFDIFGSLSTNDYAFVDLNATDDMNVIEFAPLDDGNVIAVTYVWGYYNAPPRFREIVEVDMIFNTDGGWTWGHAAFEGDTVMDVINIATHELGHACGMGDLYDPLASEETMYGYSRIGEIKKRDLYDGDIAGIKNLYK